LFEVNDLVVIAPFQHVERGSPLTATTHGVHQT
jgi:hypothetical protein